MKMYEKHEKKTTTTVLVHYKHLPLVITWPGVNSHMTLLYSGHMILQAWSYGLVQNGMGGLYHIAWEKIKKVKHLH